MHSIDDSRIDAIKIEPARRHASRTFPPVTFEAEGELIPIKHLLETVAWGHLDLFAKQVVDRVGFHNEAGELLFAGDPDIDPDVEPFEGVLFRDFFGNEVLVSEAAFRRLMNRFFTVSIGIANERGLEVREDPRWPAFLQHAARMEQLAENSN
jgi:hypothetical protein